MGLLWSSQKRQEIWLFAIGTAIIALFVHYTYTRGATWGSIGIFLFMAIFIGIDLLLKRKGPMGKNALASGC